MKQKLFENISGNQFRLITESVDDNPKAKLVREGLKKVFSSGNKKLSYKRMEGVGMGYIKDVSEAKKTAIQEARELASEYGYVDHENSQAFVKEDEHSESDAHNQEENREVQIAKGILQKIHLIEKALPKNSHPTITSELQDIGVYAQELIALHTGKAVTKPGTGGMSYKAGSIY